MTLYLDDQLSGVILVNVGLIESSKEKYSYINLTTLWLSLLWQTYLQHIMVKTPQTYRDCIGIIKKSKTCLTQDCKRGGCVSKMMKGLGVFGCVSKLTNWFIVVVETKLE